ncbi:hypothetical protein GCM10010124_06580 [Pilimelia terevasa]|uniref:Potassium channel domain-containing protein n=1 Tax=Pilimelia terevasa TaxID=53372 RepID=A0A8J3BF20_9ACTN|nr:hypothetical protein GCM10010124_06580 [Pilimelia terevasa]
MTVGRAVLTSSLIVGLYYVVPVEPGVTGLQLVVRLAVTLCVGVLITWLIARQVVAYLSRSTAASLSRLFTVTTAGVVTLALTDYVVAVSYPGQFVGLATRTDALYFAVATLLTVGFGDVHADGQLARAVVIVQMIFNVGVLTGAGSILGHAVSDRISARHHATR